MARIKTPPAENTSRIVRQNTDLVEKLKREKMRNAVLTKRLKQVLKMLHEEKLCSCYPKDQTVPQLCDSIHLIV